MSDIPATGTSQPVCCTTIKLELRKKTQHMEQPFSDTGKVTQDFDSWEKNVVQSPSCVRLFTTPCTAAHEASLSLTISPSLPKFMSIESVMSSNYLILCHPLFLMPSIFPSIRVFSNESGGQGIRVSASASVLPTNIQGWFPLGLTGLISLLSKGISRVFSSTQFKSINSSSTPWTVLKGKKIWHLIIVPTKGRFL